jgi:hypothetical protein
VQQRADSSKCHGAEGRVYRGSYLKMERQLALVPFYPHRTKWPSRLFHHTPVENAAEVLRRGALLSRNASAGARQLDVADADVIARRDAAHDSARLYFRPRTPTQYSIEGVRKRSEYFRGADKHAPTLVMFIFDARKVLALPGVRFSDGNMQSSGTLDGDSEAFFSSIDFSVYSTKVALATILRLRFVAALRFWRRRHSH